MREICAYVYVYVYKYMHMYMAMQMCIDIIIMCIYTHKFIQNMFAVIHVHVFANSFGHMFMFSGMSGS